MNNKIRVGRRQADGSWSGAIGVYFETRLQTAKSGNKGVEKGRRTAPGSMTVRNRERVLRVLSRIADENKIEWLHQLNANRWLEAYDVVVDEARKDRRVRGELKANTLNNYIATLSAFAHFAAKKKMISKALMEEILEQLPPMHDSEQQYLVVPSDKWETLFEQARSRHIVEAVFLHLAVFLAMRSSEIQRVTWGDLTFGEKPIAKFFRDKNKSRKHTLVMHSRLVAILLEWQEWLKNKCEIDSIPPDWPVVPARLRAVGGERMHPDWPVDPEKPIGKDSAGEWAKKAMLALGYSKEEMFGQACHVFRRSAAEDLFQKTGNVRKVSAFLGHGKTNRPNIDTTLGYLGHSVKHDELGADIESLMTRFEKAVAALPAGGNVIVPSLDDIQMPAPEPVADSGSAIATLDDFHSEEMWAELVNRLTAEQVLTRAVEFTSHLPEETQLALVTQARARYFAAIERAQLKLLAAQR